MDRHTATPPDPEGVELLTLAQWAQRCGYSYSHAWKLSQQQGFPAPEPGRYLQVPKQRAHTPLPEGVDPDQAVTLNEFAGLIGVSPNTVSRVVTTHTEPLPPLADATERTARPTQGHRQTRKLLDWWNRRPATTTRVRLYAAPKLTAFAPHRHSPLPSAQELGVDPQQKVTLSRFATIIGQDPGNVGQYRRLHPKKMPHTADGRRVQDLAHGEQAEFVFEDLRRWWPSRPGSRLGYRADQDDKDREHEGPATPREGVTLSGFAKANGVDPAKVHRARHQHTASMPDTVDGRRPETLAKGERARFHPDPLLRWWESLR